MVDGGVKKRFLWALVVMGLWVVLGGRVSGQVTEFKGTAGVDWNNAANWTNGIPVAGGTFGLPAEPSPFPFAVPVVIDGHTASAQFGLVGNEVGESAILYIQNGGSLNVSNVLWVGRFATGEIEISSGGALTGGTLEFAGSAQGKVTVSGSGSLVSMIEANFGNVVALATGNLTVSDGARAQFLVVAAGRATLQVEGTAGARGVLATNDFFGDPGTNATVTLAGGVVEAQTSTGGLFGLGWSVVLAGEGGFVDTAGHAVGVDRAISGSGALHKIGNGTLSLTGANTYSGGTVVSQGTLVVSGNSSVGSGTLQVGAGAVLAGTGTIAGNTVVDGVVSPGTSIGQLTITSASSNPTLTLGNSAVAHMEIGSLVSFDRVLADGPIAFDGTLEVAFLNGYLPALGNSFQLFAGGAPGTGGFDAVLFATPGYAGNFDPTSGTLVVTAVPEATTSLLVLAAATAALARRRRGGWPRAAVGGRG